MKGTFGLPFTKIPPEDIGIKWTPGTMGQQMT